MRINRKAMLAAGLIAGAAMMTGCTANTTPAATDTPKAVQKQTVQPEVSPTGTMGAEESQTTLALHVDGKKADEDAVKENGKLLLPLEATGSALGWKVDSKRTEAETQTNCEITLQRDESRITVSYEVSDNTIRRIAWQKDGLLIPVDTNIETFGGTVYVPAAFFEEAMDAKISEGEAKVEVFSPEPMDTPQTNQ